jgi:hypothetical protein
VGSIPIARSRNPDDSTTLTWPRIFPGSALVA